MSLAGKSYSLQAYQILCAKKLFHNLEMATALKRIKYYVPRSNFTINLEMATCISGRSTMLRQTVIMLHVCLIECDSKICTFNTIDTAYLLTTHMPSITF
jgi:hypothetical protein